MSDNWDFYLCRVDGEIASIFVDLGIADDTPIAHLPNMAHIRLFLRKPREDGLSSQEEFDTLDEIEDALSATLVSPKTCVYVGRNTTAGFRDFVFYIADPEDWAGRVKRALLSFQDYRFDTGARPDQQWLTYREFLYPSAQARQQIMNRQLRGLLIEKGDDVTAPREIDHWVHFPTLEMRSAFLKECEAKGFELRVPLDAAPDDGRYWLQIFHVAPADYSLDDTITELSGAAQRLGGEYDGWETTLAAKMSIDKNAK